MWGSSVDTLKAGPAPKSSYATQKWSQGEKGKQNKAGDSEGRMEREQWVKDVHDPSMLYKILRELIQILF